MVNSNISELCYQLGTWMNVPWKSNHHFLEVGFRTTIILVGVYHLPKGTTIFKMVVDFQGVMTRKTPFREYPCHVLPNLSMGFFSCVNTAITQGAQYSVIRP